MYAGVPSMSEPQRRRRIPHSKMRTRYLLAIGVLFVVLGGGAVALRSTPDPHVYTLTLGTNPWGLAVDGRTGLAFVVNRANFRFIPVSSASLSNRAGAPGYGGAPNYFIPSSGADSVSVVDIRSGKLLRDAQVGPDPRNAAVDETSGRVFVTNDDDAS